MKVTKDFILRQIAGEHILIPVGEAALSIHGMITMTESGVLLWEELQTGCSKEQLIETILAEYDVNRETAEKDVEAFLQKLNQRGILEV